MEAIITIPPIVLLRRLCAVFFAAALILSAVTPPAHASVALLVEEPFGEFGAMNPTGHAALYLDHVCAATPTSLRPCQPGELGVVLSRYHKVDGYDWIAIPLVPYLYSVSSIAEIPDTVTPAQVATLRDTYRRANLLALAPSTPADATPSGEWIQLIGSSYDRRIFGFELPTTPDQDASLIAYLNDRRNVAHFNLFFHNCADFSRVLLNRLYPGLVRRNFVADLGLTTPKHAAKDLELYAAHHPEAHLTTFLIPQVPGTVERSRPVRGVAESLVRQKRYLVPLAILHPEITGGILLAYLSSGRVPLPQHPPLFSLTTAAPPLDQSAPCEDTSCSAR